MENKRCQWANGNSLLARYHDEEWGVPVFEDKKQFEFLSLEALQCGLSWMTVLRKREALNRAFAGFDVDRVAQYGEKEIQALLEDPEIIRSRRKIEAIVQNARCFQEIRREFGSFSRYLWDYVDGLPKRVPPDKRGGPTNQLSDQIAKDLKKRGFRFLGSVTLYAHLQAAGLLNDHEEGCFRAKLPPVDAGNILGKWVYIKMDRPIGAEHPKHPGLIYPINYGFVPGLLGGDGEEQDVYLLGVTDRVSSACAQVIAVIHRLDDVEDKWVAASEGAAFTKEEILEQVRFQEQYHRGEIAVYR